MNFRKTIGPALYLFTGVLASAPVTPASAQSALAYPLKGQSAEQIRKDELDCQMWAMERTGFNPRQGPRHVSASASTSSSYSSSGFGSGETGQGGVVRDGARGAAVGALGGAIAGNAGKGAAWGALGGAVFGGVRRNKRKKQEADWERQQQQQVHEQNQQLQQEWQRERQSYDSAIGLCMESRNYKVRF